MCKMFDGIQVCRIAIHLRRQWSPSIASPAACTPIPLILFPVPLAVRSYLRSLLFIIVCLPAQSPPLLSRFSSLPPPCADTLPLSHFHVHAYARIRANSRVSSAHYPHTPPSLSCDAVSFTSLLHPRTDSQLQAMGGAGWDI